MSKKKAEVVHTDSYMAGNSYVHYFESHGWSFSNRPDEDGDIQHARDAIKAWKAWYKFIKSGKLDKAVKKIEALKAKDAKRLAKKLAKNKKTS